MDGVSILIIGFLIATATFTIASLLGRLRNDIIDNLKELIEEMQKGERSHDK